MDFLNLLAINQQLFFNDRNAQIEDAQQLSPQQSNPERSHKRKRLRRHPVWEYFGDIGDAGDKVVGCKLCSFNTVSAFSTNLKMHLKSHHKPQFVSVMEKELDQLSKDNPNETVAMSDLDIGPSRTKRRRKTVQELQETIDRAKASMERDKNHQRLFVKNSYLPVCAKPSSSSLEAENRQNILVQSPAAITTSSPLSTQVKDDVSHIEPTKVDLHSLITMLKTLENDSQTNKLASSFRKNLQEATFVELINQHGPAIMTNAFMDFIYTLDPLFEVSIERILTNLNSKSSL